MKPTWMAVAALAGLVATQSLAGGKHCPLSTQECLDKMAHQMKQSGWIGVELDDDNSDQFVVTQVVPRSPAEEAGLKVGDVLLAANGVAMSPKNPEPLAKAKAEWTPGKSIQLTVRRDGSDRQIGVKLATMPADILARYIGEHMMEHASMASGAK